MDIKERQPDAYQENIRLSFFLSGKRFYTRNRASPFLSPSYKTISSVLIPGIF